LALSADYQQPVCHSHSLPMAIGGGGSSGRYAMRWHSAGLRRKSSRRFQVQSLLQCKTAAPCFRAPTHT
jgi:hypothetical protein